VRPPFRTFLYLTPLALAGIIYLLARADRTGVNHELIADPWPLAAIEPSFEEGVLRADRRSEARRQVTLALIDGRLTLTQAAAHFRDIDAELPDETRRRWRWPQYTEEEWPYRQVINAVRVEFASNRRAPAQADEWGARLEAELRQHLRLGFAPAAEGEGGPEGNGEGRRGEQGRAKVHSRSR
jgi:hypothetical protein